MANTPRTDEERFRFMLYDPILVTLFLYEATNADTFGGSLPAREVRDQYVRDRIDEAIAAEVPLQGGGNG